MKRLKPLAAGLACILFLADCTSPSKDPPRVVSARSQAIRAVSLKGLQQVLKDCAPNCPQELLKIAGIRRLAGVIVDRGNSDLILYGRVDQDSPPLNLDDFVVALRHAWLKYAVRDGNVLRYSSPGCSIDPLPENVRTLQAIGQHMEASTSLDTKEKYIQEWKIECEKPQTVRVLGIPFNTHFAQVMVKADYDLKRLVDGTDVIDIPGFVSISDMMMYEAGLSLSQGQTIALPGSILNRFWLYPGQNVYEEDEEAFFIKQCPVTLQTELMHSNATGEIQGAGATDPHADKFASQFTLLYGKIAQDRPVYRELEDLFRFVAVAAIIKQSVEDNAGFDLSYFLENYQVSETSVEKTVAGRHSVKEFRKTSEDAHSYSELRFWLPSCGGVDITIADGARLTNRDGAGVLSKLKAAILKSKPSPDSFYWDYSSAPDFLSELEMNADLWESNQLTKGILVVVVVRKPEGYVVYDGQSQPLYKGDDLPELVRRTKAKAASDERKAVQAFFKDFPDSKSVQLFLNTYEIQSERYNLIKNPLADSAADFIEQRNLFFAPGVGIGRAASRIEPISAGEYKGRFRLILNFFVKAGRAVKHVTIHVITQTRKAAEAFLTSVLTNFSGPNSSSPKPLADIIDEAHKELKQRFPPQEVIRIYIDQYGAKPQSKLDLESDETVS